MPLDEPEGRRLGLISVDDPRDRLLPPRARLQALRLFANQAVAALQTADRAVRLRHEATHDPLTGLPNRRAFLARLNREAGRSEAELALILCDMDNLKRVNDRHGHDAAQVGVGFDILANHQVVRANCWTCLNGVTICNEKPLCGVDGLLPSGSTSGSCK